MSKLNRIISILFLFLCIILIFIFGKYRLTLAELNMHKEYLIRLVESHFFTASWSFIIIYILFVTFMLPGAVVLSLAGGLLFGVFLGSLYVTVGATVGAFFAFLATRYLFGTKLQKKYAEHLVGFNAAMTQYGTMYLFVVRLIPLFPFFLVNMLAGLTNVSSKVFLITTALGILPLVFGFTYLGFQLRHTETIEDFFSYPLAVAGILIIVLLILHRLAKRRRHPTVVKDNVKK